LSFRNHVSQRFIAGSLPLIICHSFGNIYKHGRPWSEQCHSNQHWLRQAPNVCFTRLKLFQQRLQKRSHIRRARVRHAKARVTDVTRRLLKILIKGADEPSSFLARSLV
jgi:hypothetical protein